MTRSLPPTIDVSGAAEVLKVHEQTVLDLIADCVLPAAKPGRSYVLLTKDVLAYVEQQIIKETAARMRVAKKAPAEAPKPAQRRRRPVALTLA